MDNSTLTIPLAWYCDPVLAAHEKQKIVNQLPFYFAHQSAAPQPGHYYVMPTTFSGKILIHNKHGIEVISNICRHRQSTLLSGVGKTHYISCPVHSWSYNLEGELLAAHHVQGSVCEQLEKTPTSQWRGFVFNNAVDVALLDTVGHFKNINFEDFYFTSVEAKPVEYNWKIFMELFLDLYHITSIHPGLRKFADCNQLDWESATSFCSQKVAVKLPAPGQNPSPYYSRYIELLQELPFDHAHLEIVWFTLFPNIMIEVYPYHMVVSTTIPLSSNRSLNVIEFFQDKRVRAFPFADELLTAFKQAYLETAQEDDVASQHIQQGREALFNQQKDEHGLFQEPLERGIPLFYEYWKQHIFI